jgi:hypothetical protein
MPRRTILAAIGSGLAVVLSVWLVAAQSADPTAVTFERDIRPILETRCLSCHGPALRVSRLDLSTRDGALTGGTHGAALVPGSAEQSRLYRMVAGLDRPVKSRR